MQRHRERADSWAASRHSRSELTKIKGTVDGVVLWHIDAGGVGQVPADGHPLGVGAQRIGAPLPVLHLSRVLVLSAARPDVFMNS